jgi:hypothetical protein
MRQVFLFLTLFLCAALGGEKATAADALLAEITVRYGDKENAFKISKQEEHYQVEKTSRGNSQIRSLDAKDYQYLKVRFEKIKAANNLKSFCPRNFIEARFENKKLLGCLGAPNKTAQEIQHITNLLSLRF